MMGREKRFLFITHARSASNLLMRMMTSEQQNLKHGEYHFGVEAIGLIRKFKETSIESLNVEEQNESRKSYARMAAALKDHFDSDKSENKIVTSKEHAIFMLRPEAQFKDQQDTQWFLEDPEARLRELQSTRITEPMNLSVVDDEFLRSVTPIFLIRHPALMIPSYARVNDHFSHVPDATLKYTRIMHDWYLADQPAAGQPIIIDATDYMKNPELLRLLAGKMGLDPDQVAFTWPAATEEEKAGWIDVKVKMTKTLAASTGVVKDKLPEEIDIDAEVQKWREEFGEEKATTLMWLVKREMDDYEYLMARRLTVDQPN